MLEEEQTLGIVEIEKDIQKLGSDNLVGEAVRGITTAMMEEPKI